MGDGAMILVDGERFISRVFVIGGEESDFMGCIYKDPGTHWEMRYRFRYYRDEKIFDSDDVKSETHLAFPPEKYPTKADVLRTVRVVIDAVLMKLGYARSDLHELVIESNDPRTIRRAFEREHFMHLKEVDQ